MLRRLQQANSLTWPRNVLVKATHRFLQFCESASCIAVHPVSGELQATLLRVKVHIRSSSFWRSNACEWLHAAQWMVLFFRWFSGLIGQFGRIRLKRPNQKSLYSGVEKKPRERSVFHEKETLPLDGALAALSPWKVRPFTALRYGFLVYFGMLFWYTCMAVWFDRRLFAKATAGRQGDA